MRRRLVGAVIAVVVVAGAVWWLRGRDSTPAEPGPGSGIQQHERHAVQRAAQHGVHGRLIAGIVVDDDGHPVSGAKVHLASLLTRAHVIPEATTITDSTGAFSFGEQTALSYTLSADATQKVGTPQIMDLRDPMTKPDHMTLVVHSCEATLHGTVRDAGGGIIPRAHVSRDFTAASSGVDADDAGNYELCVAVGEASISARAEGYARASVDLFALGRIHHDFELGPEATLVGRTVRAGDHAAVANALLELRDASFRVEYGVSDDTGHFIFSNLTPGRFSIIATADELATARAFDMVASVGHTSDEVVELAGAYRISGRVVETGAKTGVAGIGVRVQNTIGSTQRTMEAITQADGSFTIDQVSPGEYRPLVYFHDIHDPPKPVVTDHDVDGVVLEVDALASIAGRATRQGKPAEGVQLSTGRNFATSAADGTFKIANLKPGTYNVGGDSRRLGAFTKGPSVTVAAGEQRTGVDVELDLAGGISGVVVDQHDAPVPGVFVSFSLVEGKDFGIATTGDDGSFHARALSGGGTYKYEVRAAQRSGLVYHAPDGETPAPIAVADGNTRIEGVRIRIQVDRLTISGKVLDAHGQPVSDMTVRAVPAGRPGSSVPTATTNPAGAFAIRDLPAGNYDLGIRGAEGAGHAEGVAAGSTDVVLRVAGLGSIDGTLVGFSDPPEIAVFQITRTDRILLNPTITGTTFHVRDVPDGSYYIIAKSKASFGFERVTVAASSAATVTLRELGTGALEGTIRDATGAAIANAACRVTYGETMFDMVVRQTGGVTSATSDASGVFRIAKAIEGTIAITCGTPDKVVASLSGKLVANQVNRFDLKAAR